MCQGGVKRNRLIVSVGRGRDPEGRLVVVDGLPRFTSWIPYVFKGAVKSTDFKRSSSYERSTVFGWGVREPFEVQTPSVVLGDLLLDLPAVLR